MGWITDAPRRTHGQVEPAMIELDEIRYPALALAFQGADAEPVTVTLVGNERALRDFQRQLDRAITGALRKCRER